MPAPLPPVIQKPGARCMKSQPNLMAGRCLGRRVCRCYPTTLPRRWPRGFLSKNMIFIQKSCGALPKGPYNVPINPDPFARALGIPWLFSYSGVGAQARMTITNDPNMHIITTTTDLAAFCERAAQTAYVTVDTEFLRERTYYSKLCLIQLAYRGDGETDAALVDPIESRGCRWSRCWTCFATATWSRCSMPHGRIWKSSI